MLLEVGEENAAVLLARSDVADVIDTKRDLHALLLFGLDPDQVEEVSRSAVGAIAVDDVNTRRRHGEMSKTISRGWATLVEGWRSNATSADPPGPNAAAGTAVHEPAGAARPSEASGWPGEPGPASATRTSAPSTS